MQKRIFNIIFKAMIYKAIIKRVEVFLVIFLLVFNVISLQGQNQFDEKFKKNADYYGMEYQIPKDYFGIIQESCYSPHFDFLQSALDHSIKNTKYAIVVAFALISTKPDTPKKINMRKVLGNPDKVNTVALAIEVDTTLSRVKYLDTLQLAKVNANRGVVYNMKIENKYMGIYGRCKKIELYKDDVGRAEILFFYNKGDDALVDDEIKKTWGMLKFK